MWLKIHRLFSLIRLLNLRRLMNFIRLYAAHHIAAKNGGITLLPPYALSLELSSVCNLKCPQCPVGLGQINRTKKMMDPNFAMQLLSRFAFNGIVINLYFQGESLLHPEFFKIASFARSKKLYIILSTNGTMINENIAEKLIDSGLQRLIISVDGLNQSSYSHYRAGGDIEKVWKGIGLVHNARAEKRSIWPEIIVQTLVNRYNENELKAIKEKAEMAGADRVKFKTMQIYTDHDKWTPRNKKFARYREKEMVRKPKRHCFRSFSGMVVSADEKFLPCCYDKQAEHVFTGKPEHFEAIVKSTERKKFLHKIYSQKTMHGICENCPEAIRVYNQVG